MSQSKFALPRNGFTFKQFFVAHDRCAMKVGTDGILLGAWAPIAGVKHVLDIGAGSGLLALAAHLGLRREQTMAVGDSGNDRAMVEAAGLGVAMGNATDDIKEIADATTDDNNHDGVAKAIEKYAL